MTRVGTVLVVDDDLDIRDTLAMILEASGYRVLTAGEGAEALRRLHDDGPVDLVLLDMMMPGMNGREFREFQRADPSLESVPVIVLTGDSHAREKAEELNAAGFLQKPVELTDLLGAIERNMPRDG